MSKEFIFCFKTIWFYSKKRIVVELLLNILKQFFNVFYGVYFLRTILLCIQKDESINTVVLILVAMMLLNIIFYLFKNHFDNLYVPIFTQNFTKHINQTIHKKRTKLSIESFESTEFLNQYTRVINNTAASMLKFLDSIGKIFGLFFALMLIFTYIVSIDIFVVLLSIIPLIAILFIRGHSEKLKYQLNVATTLPNRKKNYAKRMMYLPEYVKEIKLTKIYNQLKCIYKEGVLENIKQYKTVGKKIALLEFFGVLISDVLIVFIPLIYIVIRTAFGKYYLIGDIVGITQSTMYFSWDIEGIIDSFINIKSTKYYINEYLSFLDLEEENVQGCSLDGNDGLIFNNVSFKYINSEKNILKNINFKIKNGDKIAIVGENGSGKTTLISLMLNLYKRFDGEIILNGKDINCYSRDSLNKFFGVLLQNYHIYPFSIRDNISMGNNVDENSINEIIKYLDLNNKLDDTSKTITKEFEDNGVILSGGQEQKLAIIRLFAQKCSFVILDEPTSSLDPFSEKQVYESMFKLFHEKTIIFISHRLSSVNFVDKIFVMNNGEIIEEGSHEKLMKDKGYYFDLYSIQARRFLEEK